MSNAMKCERTKPERSEPGRTKPEAARSEVHELALAIYKLLRRRPFSIAMVTVLLVTEAVVSLSLTEVDENDDEILPPEARRIARRLEREIHLLHQAMEDHYRGKQKVN